MIYRCTEPSHGHPGVALYYCGRCWTHACACIAVLSGKGVPPEGLSAWSARAPDAEAWLRRQMAGLGAGRGV